MEMHPAILFPLTRNVILDAKATLILIGVIALYVATDGEFAKANEFIVNALVLYRIITTPEPPTPPLADAAFPPTPPFPPFPVLAPPDAPVAVLAPAISAGAASTVSHGTISDRNT